MIKTLRLYRILVLFLAIAMLPGCNSDIFIEKIDSAVSDVELDGNGDECDIEFSVGNFKYLSVGGLEDYDDLKARFYDADGKELSGFVSCNIEPGCKGKWFNNYLDLEVSRTAPDRVKIIINENMYTSPVDFTLWASTEFSDASVRVSVTPSERYVVDRVSYPGTSYCVYNEGRHAIFRKRVVNDTDEPMEYALPLDELKYSGMYRFTSEYVDLFTLFSDGEVEVDVPSFEEWVHGLYGVRVPFASKYIEVDLPGPPNLLANPVIPPHTTCEITIGADMDEIGIYAEIHGVNPVSGRERSCVGEVRAILPTMIFLKKDIINE